MMTNNDSAATGQPDAKHHPSHQLPSNKIGAPLRDAAPPVGSPAPEGIEGQGEAPAAGPDGSGEVAAWPQAVSGVRPAASIDTPKSEPAKSEPDKEPLTSDGAEQDDSAPDYSRLSLPEGYTAHDPQMEEALALFGEHRLPADAAQKLIEFAARRDKAVMEAHAQAHAQTHAKAHAAAWAEVIRGWQSALLADLGTSAEFTGVGEGGDRLKEMQSLAARAIAAYGGEDAAEIREHLKAYALGDHPAFARFLARAGRSVREDGLPRRSDGNARQGVAETLYPNQGKE